MQKSPAKVVADVEISYSVTVSNPNRPVYLEYKNENSGDDQIVVSTNFSKTYTFKSDIAKQKFDANVFCYTENVEDSSTQFQPQSVTITIKEDGVIKKTKTYSGTSYITSYYGGDMLVSLPSAIK